MNWSQLSVNMRLSILAGETDVSSYLLAENDKLMAMLRGGSSKDACLKFINRNF